MLPGFIPHLIRTYAVRMLAEPVPNSATQPSVGFLPTILKAFIKSARITAAVPYWSSCQTGIRRRPQS